MMLKKIPIHQILFIDLETVPEVEKWEDVPLRTQELWEKKTQYQRKDEISAEDFYPQRAGILAEFGKIVCISCGLVIDDKKIKIKSFAGTNEYKILNDFNQLLASSYFNSQFVLCAHNGKEFDFPFLARRLMIHQLEIPSILNIQGKKPWEIFHLDTLELWKFGDYKHYTSLDLLAHVFGLPSPKEEMDGSQVAEVFYKEKNINKIQEYCERDIVTLINVIRKMRYESVLEREKNE